MALVNPFNQQLEDEANEMYELMADARDVKDRIHQDMLTRSREIQRSKQEAELKEREKNMTEAERIKRESIERERREAERLQEEERRRLQEERDRAIKRESEAKRSALISQLHQLQGRSFDPEFVKDMDVEELTTYVGIAEAKAEKERKKRVEKESERQLHIARATREAVLEAAEQFFSERQTACVEYWTQSYNTIAEQRRAQAERLEAVRPVATKVESFLAQYVSKVSERRLERVQPNVEKRFQEAEKKRKEEEERRRREEEERRRVEEERRRVEEERRREEEERRRKEEERKRREEEEERRVEEERKRKEEEARLARLARMNADDDDEAPRSRPGRRVAPSRPAPERPTASRPAPPKKDDDDDGWVEVGPRRGHSAPKKEEDDEGWTEVGPRRGRPAPSAPSREDGPVRRGRPAPRN